MSGPAARPTPAIRVDDDFEEEYPGCDARSTECYANVMRLGDMLGAEHARRMQADFGLSPTACMVLSIIEGAAEPLSPSVIAERLIVTSASVTSLLDTLERRGLVRRLPHPEDRRRLLVDLTPDGQAIVDRLLPGAHALEREMFSVLSERERSSLLALLAKVQVQAAAIADAPPTPMGGVRNRPARLQRGT